MRSRVMTAQVVVHGGHGGFEVPHAAAGPSSEAAGHTMWVTASDPAPAGTADELPMKLHTDTVAAADAVSTAQHNCSGRRWR